MPGGVAGEVAWWLGDCLTLDRLKSFPLIEFGAGQHESSLFRDGFRDVPVNPS